VTLIGRYLLDIGALRKEEMSANTIKEWLYQHPEQAKFVMERDESYIFFKDNSKVTDGPIGAQGVTLTEQRSLAVDRRFIPLGMPLWLETDITTPSGKMPFHKLFIAQDTGGAIKGVVRGDIFFGNGTEAANLASNMKNKGTYSMLLPNTLPQ
jgi:membrane-bound lytic murein transglycosylase A